jgi:hypothetical protein
MLIAAGCADPPEMPQIPAAASPVLAGQARIWFYRDWQPSESLNLANIDINGSYFGSVANGSAFYRDVPAGHYHIAPVSYNRDFNQDKDVDVAPGQQSTSRSSLRKVGTALADRISESESNTTRLGFTSSTRSRMYFVVSLSSISAG